MQLATNTALAETLAGPDRVILNRFEVDWDRDGLYAHPLSDLSDHVATVSLSRDVSGSLPQETTAIEGFIGAQLNVTLNNGLIPDYGYIIPLLSPVREDSPLFGDGRLGVPVRWSLRVHSLDSTRFDLRQFTGYISDFKISGSQVLLVCLDGTHLLHAPINLPVFTMTDWVTNQARTAQYRINSQWVIDYILRRNGIYQSPPPHANCIYSATGHGSMIPEIGHQFAFSVNSGSFTEINQSYVPGKWGIAYNGEQGFCSYWFGRANGAFTALPNTAWLVQFMAYSNSFPFQRNIGAGAGNDAVFAVCSGRSMFAPGSTTFALRIDAAGTILADFYSGTTLVQTSTGPALGTTNGWVHVWCKVEFGSSLSNSLVAFPNQTNSGVNLGGLSATPATWDYATVLSIVPFPLQNLQFTVSAPGSDLPIYNPVTFVPQCDLDPGLTEFMSMPVVRGEDSLDVLKKVIGSEYGVAGFSEEGRFFFRNRKTVRQNNLDIEKVCDAETNLSDLSVSERPGSIRNSITTKTQNVFRSSRYETVWQSRAVDDFKIYPGTNVFRILLDSACWLYDTSDLSYTSMATWDVEPFASNTHKFHAVDAANTSVSTLTVWVRLDPVAVGQGRDEALLVVVNPTGGVVTFATTDGRPALYIGGLPAVDGPEETQTYERQWSIDRYGRQTLSLEKTAWRQISGYIRPVVLGLLEDLKAPIPLFDPITLIGDPRLQLQDTLSVIDQRQLGGPALVAVESVRRELSDGKLTDQLNVRSFARPGRWILGHPELSILGSTTKLG